MTHPLSLSVAGEHLSVRLRPVRRGSYLLISAAKSKSAVRRASPTSHKPQDIVVPVATATMRLLPHFLLLLSVVAVVNALHADEAGLTDFVLKSAGHGDVGVRYAATTVDKEVWVTSQSNEYPGAIFDLENDSIGRSISTRYYDRHCSIAGRNVTTGAVLWRVNACGGGGASFDHDNDDDTTNNNHGGFFPRHATLVTPTQSSQQQQQQQQQKSAIFSLDNTGILRKWSPTSGALLLDVDILSSNDDTSNSNKLHFSDSVPRLLDGTLVIGTVLTATTTSGNDKTGGVHNDDELLLLLDTTGGHPIKEEGNVKSSSSSGVSMVLSAKKLLEKAGVRAPKSNARNSGSSPNSSPRARIIDMHHMENSDGNRIALWVGWSTSDNTRQDISTMTSVAVIEVVLTNDPSGRMSFYRIDRALPLAMTTASSSSAGVGSTPLLLSSLRMVHHHRSVTDNSISLLAISSTKQQLLLVNIQLSTCHMKYGQIVGIDALHPYWRSIDSIRVDAASSSGAGGDYLTIRVAGVDDRYPTLPRRLESLFVLNAGLSSSSAAGGDDGGYNALHRVHGPGKRDEEIHQDALAYCADMGTVIAASFDDKGHTTIASSFRLEAKELHERTTWTTNEDGKVVIVPKSGGGKVHIPEGLGRGAHLVECSKNGVTVVFTSLGGLTTAVRYEVGDDMKVSSAMHLWSTEEGLGSITSAIFLDEAHAIAPLNGNLDADDEEEKALLDLRFTNRIRSQLQSLKNFVFGGGALSSLASLALLSDEKKAERAAAFGFAKISVLLSERLHRVMALDTANKGRIAWSMNLHPRASWHKLVHGGQFVTLNDPHGNGGVHDHEMLALSYVAGGGGGSDGSSSIVEWKCFDGISGRIFSDEIVTVSSSVMQIVPLRTLSHHPHDVRSCRQVALLIHSDDSVSVVPDSARALTTVDEAMSVADGLFVHTIDKTSGKLRALRVSRKLGAELSPGSTPFELITVGTTIFDPSQEQIVDVAYPRRGEVIQSPSTVLGDDALLLKYLNPHIMVVVTEATKAFLSSVAPVVEGGDETGDGFYNALAGGQDSITSSGQKRKPQGATKPGADTTSPPPISTASIATPSLFISLVDSVSGQILHRVSHAHALWSDITEGATTTRVPVVISENWIVYTFYNQRTRRTDVGVITLHEGMIDKNGITAFSAPEQEITFSSLESAKPIVLSKTFGLSKAVTALGVTTTRAGISSKQFLFATANDQVIYIDRRMLDPRRPSGALKESEKMEGLLRYEPLLPISPLRTPSHVHEVASVQSISSASANVESQSLVLAFGGPDIFFTRLAPSKGFDLLPDDFNRGMLTVVLVGLIVLLNVIQWMNKKKVVSTIWA